MTVNLSKAMLDEYNLKLDGWARFSADEKLRYRLARMLTPRYSIAIVDGRVMGIAPSPRDSDTLFELERVVFLMLNPSTANAFKPDNTVSKCVKFANHWGAQALEVVNLFAFRSPYPTDLDIATDRGDDETNDEQILLACRGAKRVIAGWGNNGWRGGRDEIVRDLLRRNNIPLEHLGLTGEGRPLHPLARGKAFIPIDREPVSWL